ncbi:hypothetical protein MK852_00785 [Shewanella benthica]|nr:hypothetical protein [Shewanella benthica]
MSALKMFFCIVSETKADEVTVHRELNSIYTLWNSESYDDKVGIIHIGFIRPKVPSYEEIQHFHGGILVSASVKWSLPAEYKTSNKTVYVSEKYPLFQLLSGFGYCIEITDDEEYLSESPSNENPLTSDSNHTIASAALDVLESVAKPMSKEEIYGHIIERNLFQFGAKQPINVLNVELNRHCEGTEYSQVSSNNFFGKISAGLFYALSSSSTELNGWLTDLIGSHPNLAESCLNFGIFDEKSYFKNKKFLPDTQIRELEVIRFRKLKTTINIEDPSELISILPVSILDAHITQLGLTVRTCNVFSVQNIFTLKDTIGYSLRDMMKWPNFGKKSAKDLCEFLNANVEKLSFLFPIDFDSRNVDGINVVEENIETEPTKNSRFEYAKKTSLKLHFENSLSMLKDNERMILENRTGYQGPVKTLEEIGSVIGVTRERIRQIQKKNVSNIINTEFWDDCIAIKIGELLLNREQPLYLEMLELEDDWFSGFIGNYQHLSAIIELFSENQIRLIKIDGAMVISRIHQDTWDGMVSFYRKSLKIKASEQNWTKQDIDITFKVSLEKEGASELLPLLWNTFTDKLIFDDAKSKSETLISYGNTLYSSTLAVLHQAESPLHFSIIAERVYNQFGKTVTAPQVNSCLHKVGAKLFERGVYGLPKFNPISDATCQHLRLVVEKLIYSESLMKQWHTSEFLSWLQGKFPALPKQLNQYLLNMILEHSEILTYLNKNVWVRSDSKQTSEDRVDMADAFTKILEDSGTPLKGVDLKERLKKIRGVNEVLQLQPTERMILIGPDTWGLIDRDIGGTEEGNRLKLDAIFKHLLCSQKGIHVSEVTNCLISYGIDSSTTSSYALLSLAHRDERFFLGRAMFLGLSEWAEDVRRLNYSQAVRRILKEMDSPMSIAHINQQVEILTGLDVDGTVTNLLINQGAKYNSIIKRWERG